MANGRRPKKRIIPTKLNKFRNWKNILIYASVFLFLAFFFMALNAPSVKNQDTIPLSSAIQEVKKDKVREIEVLDNKLILKLDKTSVQAFKEPNSNIYTLFKDAGVDLSKTKVSINDKTTINNWVNILVSILPIILMVGFFYFI